MTIDKQQLRQFTADWHVHFPELGVYKPGCLFCRCGPLVMGVRLWESQGGTAYIPCVHAYVLRPKWPRISGILSRSVPTDQNGISVWFTARSHTPVAIAEVARKLRARAPLSIDATPITRGQVEAAYRALNVEKIMAILEQCYTDLVALRIWCGDVSGATDVIEHATTALRSQVDDAGIAQWRKSQIELIANRDRIPFWHQRSINRHKLGQLPEYEFINDAPPTGLRIGPSIGPVTR